MNEEDVVCESQFESERASDVEPRTLAGYG